MLNIRKNVTLFVFAICTLMCSATLIAAEFTFNVPIKLTNLHDDITHVMARCRAIKLSSFGSAEIAAGHVTEPVLNGSIDKTLTVGINSTASSNPANAGWWECFAFVCIDSNCQDLTSDAPNEAFKIAPGTTAAMHKQGPL